MTRRAAAMHTRWTETVDLEATLWWGDLFKDERSLDKDLSLSVPPSNNLMAFSHPLLRVSELASLV